MVKSPRISYEFISQLNNWEILAAYSYCNNIIKRNTVLYREEFDTYCFFYFDGNEEHAVSVLEDIKNQYVAEYSKRNCN